jgi:hypothetical protein
MWERTAKTAEEGRIDVKSTMSNVQLCVTLNTAVIQPKTENYSPFRLQDVVESLFYRVPSWLSDSNWPLKIALRMTCGPTNSCIDFHTDGSYVKSTTQIALNDLSEFKGGLLCFFVKKKTLDSIPHVIQYYPPHALHGVTSITEGTRKAFLFWTLHMVYANCWLLTFNCRYTKQDCFVFGCRDVIINTR